jgi:membrane protein DedA with SNARE-associated domain
METYFQTIAANNNLLVYSILFIFIFLENTLPFIPGDGILILAAYLSGRGILMPLMTLLITTLGSAAGFLFAFAFSRYWGREYFEHKNYRFMPAQRMAKIDHYFQRFGTWLLAFCRLIPGSRLLIALTAGFSNISYYKALIFTTGGIVLWNGAIFALGNILGQHWATIKLYLASYNKLATIIIIVIAGIIILKLTFSRIQPERTNNG